MKQKIVIKVQIRCGKCRKKAMKIAATAEGVISVAIQGNNKDEIVVIGVQVDSAGLCTTLRKKLGCANLLSIQEVKDPKPEDQKKKDEEKPAEKKPAAEEQKPAEEGDQKKNSKDEAAKSESKSAAEAAVFNHQYVHQYPPNYYNYPPLNYCSANPPNYYNYPPLYYCSANPPPQYYLYTTRYEDNPAACNSM